MTADINELRDAIQRLHGENAIHVLSVPVTETFAGKTFWRGIVEVFDLFGHPVAPRVYAWSHDTEDPKHPRRHVTVLHILPVVSPQLAVKAAIVQEYRNHGGKEA